MFFDDRLATVLRQRAQSDSMRRTQYRQLLDLLGSQESGAQKTARDPSLVAAAWMRMNKLAETINTKDRARLISEPGWRLRNPELVAHLADFEPDVASAALSRANLSSEDWTALIPRLPVRARGFLRLRRDLPNEVEGLLEKLGVHDRGLPQPIAEGGDQAAVEPSGSLDEEPLDLEVSDELPGSNIPLEDLSSEPVIRTPIGPLSGGSDNDENEGSVDEARPIFFPKDQQKRAASESTPPEQDFTPEPFTIDELREIAEEPLGSDEPSDDKSLGGDAVDDDTLDGETLDGETLDFDIDSAPPPTPRIGVSDVTREDSAQKGGAQEDSELSAPNSDEPNIDERSEISALVERISTFRREKAASRTADDLTDDKLEDGDGLMPRLPLGEDASWRKRVVRGFGFAADAAGRIEWAEDDVAPMIVGTRLVAPTRWQALEPQSAITAAFNARQPIKAAPFIVTGAPAIAGDWVVDAQPRFSQIGGFAGYAGRMRRPIEAAPPEKSPAQQEADRIRQLLHELRTPVTAVQGYSEVIQQQLFGSAPHEYRALAAAIASDAARILSGFDELDRLAKLETGAIEIGPGKTDIASLTEHFVRQLGQVLDARMAGLELTFDPDVTHEAAIDEDSAESLMWRLLASIGGACGAGETLQIRLRAQSGQLRLSCDLPMQLLGEEDLFAVDARPLSTAVNPGIFGAGFALRLARAEARAAGGDLVRAKETVTLTLPRSGLVQSETEPDVISTDS